MTIYVDDYNAPFRGMHMSHLLSDDSVEELHVFAKQLGLKRAWFQPGSAPHYDVSRAKRELALQLGAVSLICGSAEWLKVYRKAKELVNESSTRKGNEDAEG
jgi:hypothetical protein